MSAHRAEFSLVLLPCVECCESPAVAITHGYGVLRWECHKFRVWDAFPCCP